MSSMYFFLMTACQPSFTEADTSSDDTAIYIDDTGDTQESTDIEIYINEFMASNQSYEFDDSRGTKKKDDDTYTPDWIELYNDSSETISLLGYFITDDLEEPEKHELGDLTLPPGGHVLLFADGDASLGDDHLGFRLEKDEEEIGLYTPGGLSIDLISFTDQVADMAAARIPDGGDFSVISDATPGTANPSQAD